MNDEDTVVVPRAEDVARLAAEAATRGASLRCGDYLGEWEEGDHPYGKACACPFCHVEQSYTNLWYNGPGSPPSYAWQCCDCGAQGPTSSGRFRGDHYGAILDAKALWDAAAPSTSVREEVVSEALAFVKRRLRVIRRDREHEIADCAWNEAVLTIAGDLAALKPSTDKGGVGHG